MEKQLQKHDLPNNLRDKTFRLTIAKISFAILVSITAVGMAVVAAWDRGGTVIDRSLYISISALVVLSVHLLPSFSKRGVAWFIWIGVFLCALYGHLTFFTHSSNRAGQLRPATAQEVMGLEQQKQSIINAISSIQARPLVLVADEIAKTTNPLQLKALRIERKESKRLEKYQDDLIALDITISNAKVTATEDPVLSLLARVMGSNVSNISVSIALLFSILLELVGTLLWYEVLVPSSNELQPKEPAPEEVDSETTIDSTIDPVAKLKAAIKAGKCKPTVTGIRQYLSCGQDKAHMYKKALSM